jgi:hemerythrin-like domain-containing protein
MLRNEHLAPLSRQHQHALALCVRIHRAMQSGELEMLAWQAEIQELFIREIRAHFEAEEREVFPVASRFPELADLTEDLMSEHTLLRDYFALATERAMDPAKLHDFASKLSAHIRKEERQLFESLQRVLSAQDFSELGSSLTKALNETSASCHMPRPTRPAED